MCDGSSGSKAGGEHRHLIYSESDLRSLVAFLMEFDYTYEPLYALIEEWLDGAQPPEPLPERLRELFPHIYYVLFCAPVEQLGRYCREIHEGPVAAWRLTRERGEQSLS
jgi:hypothetical protein